MNYPNKKKSFQKEVNKANLGMTLESDIDATNRYYLDSGIAVIHKKPTPIQVVNVSYPARNKAKITEAYYKTPSTTDYNGVFKGKYIDFDAKETNSTTSFPLKNIHPHQISHLTSVEKQNGIAFFIIHFKPYNEYYILPIHLLMPLWENQYKEKGRKSIPYAYFKDNLHQIHFSYQPRLDYLKVIQTVFNF
ncbi:Holliday junction resolvase RecU [Alteracholeplasma palmae J233]|uniref:Holliday junction resolvase RecU n=1 Tax=Alteracholeplasma palmae (strain ATCC 49389 / J233) TaxID=1318466 RepID=U4KRQ0_ALTPJ|nr:Holliday junction resolvase RecU [Alteracholeplasma palmae]CCV64361.1 Holliday junction resolvase RecU [Alteracholeplasma palmae J233]